MALTEWSAPASGGTISGVGASADFHNVYHAGGYWFSLARTDDTDIYLRYASDPTAAWSTATLPAWPSGVTLVVPVDSGGVQYDGTHYGFALTMGTASRVYYATDPSGTWTEYQFEGTGKYTPRAILHDGTRWVMAGRYTDTAAYPNPAWVGYTAAGSAVNSTWTLGTTTAATGYDVADLGVSGTRSWTITALEFDGTTYVTSANRNPTSGINGHLRYCTDITAASWGTPTTTQIEDTNELRYYADAGHWVSMGANPTPYYTDTPTGTWTAIGTASTGLVNEVLGVAYGDGSWVAAGADEPSGTVVPAMSYLATSSPAGTYTEITAAQHGFAQNAVTFLYSVEYSSGYWVAAAEQDCELRWAFTGTTTAPTYLRQRQSAVRAPSRVSPVNLRNRQTTMIR